MKSLDKLRIAVVGAGAVGSFYGGLMARAGFDVTLIARGRHREAMERGGLVIDSFSLGRFTVPVKVAEELSGSFDIVILAVKVHDTETACRSVQGHLDSEGFIATFQNGVENVDLAIKFFGPESVVAGSLFVALGIDPPGTVRHTAAGRVSFGAPDPAARRHEETLQALLRKAGCEHKASSNIRLVLWKKLLWNVAFNPLSALLQSSCGRMARNPEIRELMTAMVEEGVRAAEAEGVVVPEEYWKNVVTVTEGLEDYKTSMYQDVEKHRPLELDGILGPVLRKNRLAGRSAPRCETVLAALRFKYGGHYLYTPRLAADVIVLNGDSIVLIERKNPPHGWAIPGGFVDYGERVEDAAVRELGEETGIAVGSEVLELLGVYSDPKRDRRGHVASVIYVARSSQIPAAGDDAAQARFFPLSELPLPLAFDHELVLTHMAEKYGVDVSFPCRGRGATDED